MIGIPYIRENANTPIISEVIEEIIKKKSHIFNNIVLVSRSCIIKISPKSNMTIIWIDIWDIQSSNRAKGLINRYFNVGSYIATIRDASINSSMPQYKNCWK